jgi:putative redox protein
MRTDLSVRAIHLGEMRVDVHVREHVLSSDYPAVAGKAPTSLELLLAALASCAANTVNLVLGRGMGTKVSSLQVEVHAQRREDHPTILTEIELTYHIQGEGLQTGYIDRAIRIAEDQLCPLTAMLRPGTKISSSWRID